MQHGVATIALLLVVMAAVAVEAQNCRQEVPGISNCFPGGFVIGTFRACVLALMGTIAVKNTDKEHLNVEHAVGS